MHSIQDDISPLVAFSKGLLTAIERDGHSIAYAYDCFGRTTQDGELTYGHDANGYFLWPHSAEHRG